MRLVDMQKLTRRQQHAGQPRPSSCVFRSGFPDETAEKLDLFLSGRSLQRE